jgi:flavin reductase (DIM6/NTAB) family NADH-FMN oxidoreductase RutF
MVKERVDMGMMEAVQMLPPAPVVLVAVGDKAGKERNVLTVGMFNLFSAKPPIIGIGVLTSRHSYKLLEECPDFTINIPGKDMLDQVLKCASSTGKNVDKFKEFGLTAVPGKRVGSPKIAEALISMEIKKTESFEKGDHTWYLGEIKHTDIVENYDIEEALLFWDGKFRLPGKVIKEI